MNFIEIENASGQKKTIKIERFKALDGWEIQHKFLEFAATTDKNIRRAFTLEVLTYATVVMDAERELPLTTDALIDNHLESWENVQRVFEEILQLNGINPATHAEKPHYWATVGEEIAVSFMAACSKLVGPAMENMAAIKDAE